MSTGLLVWAGNMKAPANIRIKPNGTETAFVMAEFKFVGITTA
jgi:hypothetical protein